MNAETLSEGVSALVERARDLQSRLDHALAEQARLKAEYDNLLAVAAEEREAHRARVVELTAERDFAVRRDRWAFGLLQHVANHIVTESRAFQGETVPAVIPDRTPGSLDPKIERLLPEVELALGETEQFPESLTRHFEKEARA